MVSWLWISKCDLHSPLESMLMKCFVIWFPWKLDMCCLGDLGNMIEMLSTMGSPIDILSRIKVKRQLSHLCLQVRCARIILNEIEKRKRK